MWPSAGRLSCATMVGYYLLSLCLLQYRVSHMIDYIFACPFSRFPRHQYHSRRIGIDRDEVERIAINNRKLKQQPQQQAGRGAGSSSVKSGFICTSKINVKEHDFDSDMKWKKLDGRGNSNNCPMEWNTIKCQLAATTFKES